MYGVPHARGREHTSAIFFLRTTEDRHAFLFPGFCYPAILTVLLLICRTQRGSENSG
jgi:hypothetical protein